MSNISIDGKEAIEFMSEEQREEYVSKKYGMTWNEFVEDSKKHENDPLISPDTKFLN